MQLLFLDLLRVDLFCRFTYHENYDLCDMIFESCILFHFLFFGHQNPIYDKDNLIIAARESKVLCLLTSIQKAVNQLVKNKVGRLWGK